MNVILIKNENISRSSLFVCFFFAERFSAPRTHGTCELNRRKKKRKNVYGTCAKQYDWGVPIQ